MKLKIMLLFLLISLPLVSSMGFSNINLGGVKKNDCVIIIQTCDNCTYVNLTRVTINNKNISYPNLQMTSPVQGNYNYSYCNNGELGNYIVTTCGNSNGGYTCDNFNYVVTNSGYIKTTSESLGLLGYLMIYIFLTAFLLILGVYLTNSDYLWILGILFIFLSLILLIYVNWLGVEYYTSYTNANNTDMPETIFWIVCFVIVAGLWGAIVMVIANWKKLVKFFKDEIKNREEDEVDREFDDIFK